MLFKPHHIDMIRKGIKTATRRRWKRSHAKTGGTYAVQKKMYEPRVECPIIKANRVYVQRLGDMTEEDARKEGGYTMEQFKQIWLDVCGVPLDPNEAVHVVEFDYVGEGAVDCRSCKNQIHGTGAPVCQNCHDLSNWRLKEVG